MGRRKSEFGEHLTSLIKQAGMSQADFYMEVGIAKPYFYDILSGKVNPPPFDVQVKMLDVLDKETEPNQDRRDSFFDLAARYREEIPADIDDLINRHPEKWDEIRTMLGELLAAREGE